MQHHHLLFDRRWLYWDSGPWAPNGTCDFRIYQPTKLAEPLLIADQPWESMSTGWHTLLYDQGHYRCWYEAWDDTYTTDVEGRLCYAESDDGVTWCKPELGLIEFRGSTRNNILIDGAQAFHGFGFHGSNVFIDPTAEPAERYKLIYLGNAHGHFGEGWLGVMMQGYSSDGLHWRTRTHPCWGGPPTLLAHGSDTQTVAFWDPGIRQYVGYFRSWEPGYGRAIARAVTNDFYNWPAPKTIVHCDHLDPYGADIYNNAANRYQHGDETAYFFFMSMFNHAKDTLNVQLATSRDGVYWARHDRAPFIDHGPATFDRGGIYTAPSILPFRDGLAVPYHGVSYKHGEATPGQIRYQGALGMVTMPRDRFQGVHTDSDFDCCLQPFTLESERLDITLNAVVQDGGEIRAALISDNQMLPDMSFAECTPITGDQPAAQVYWKGQPDLHALLGKTVMLRLHLEKATVYAVTLTG